MNLAKFSINRPIATIMILLFLVTAGLFGLSRLSVSLTPNIDVPSILVMTIYPNASSIDVLHKVTKPLEEILNTVTGVKTLRSTSEKNRSMITIEFDWNTNIDLAALEIREKLNTVKLPDETEKPTLHRVSLSAQPIFRFDLYGDCSIDEIREYAEKTVTPAIERIDGVGRVEVKGGYEKIVSVACNPNSLASKKITMFEIIDKIEKWRKSIQIGKIVFGRSEHLAVVSGNFESIDDLKNLILKNNIKLSELADISIDNKQITNISRLNGIPSVSVLIKKTNEGNTLDIITNIRKIIPEMQKQKKNISFNISKDDSTYIIASQEVVNDNLKSGVFLVVGILFLFLRSFKSTVIISLSIPITLAATFICLYFSNVTRNILSLAGLALGLGMVLDGSIVILENIYRHLNEGRTPKDAAYTGCAEVGLSVFTSNLTSIAVFFPILLLSGIASKLFTDLALTIIYSNIISTFVSFLLVPMMAAYMFTYKKEEKNFAAFEFVDRILVSIGNFFIKIYKAALSFCLGVRFEDNLLINFFYKLTIVSAIVGICVFCIKKLPERIFLPDGNVKEFKVTFETVSDINIFETDRLTRNIEKSIKTDKTAVIATTVAPANSEIYVKLNDSVSQKQANEYLKKLEDFAAVYKGGRIFVSKVSKITMNSKTIEFSVGSPNNDLLLQSSKEIKNYLDGGKGILFTKLRGLENNREISLTVNKHRLSENGISTKYISENIYAVISGATAGKFTLDKRRIDIIVQGKKANDDFDKTALLAYPVMTGTGQIKRISEFVALSEYDQTKEINRTNLNNVITLESLLDLKTAAGKILNLIDKEIVPKYSEKKLDFYWYGNAKNTKEAFTQLGIALVFSLFLVYIIMASQFESVIQPFIILFSVPLVMIGVAFGLFIMQLQLDISAIIGIIMLSGVVVNNGIILIDYLNVLRQQGVSRTEAILVAGGRRLRPIAITAVTSIIGMIPLAISTGEGSELYQGCAVVVIFGLTSSTLLTLFVVPLVYSIFDDFVDVFNLLFFKIQMFWEIHVRRTGK